MSFPVAAEHEKATWMVFPVGARDDFRQRPRPQRPRGQCRRCAAFGLSCKTFSGGSRRPARCFRRFAAGVVSPRVGGWKPSLHLSNCIRGRRSRMMMSVLQGTLV